jgi:hypothetical protein
MRPSDIPICKWRSGGALSDRMKSKGGQAPARIHKSYAALAGLACMTAVSLSTAHAAEQSDVALNASRDSKVNAPASMDDPSSFNLRMAQGETASFAVRDISGEAKKPIPLDIEMSAGAVDKYKFFMVVGLPDGFEMSTGFPTKNAWLVSVNNITGLQIIPSANFVGSVRLQIMLFKGKDDVPETRTVALTVVPANVARAPAPVIEKPAAATPQPRSEQVAIQPAPPKLPKRSISDEEEGRTMIRAYEMLQNADIAAARLLYESMSMKGSGKAAFAMGQTFDPEFLQNFVVEGLRPNLDQARKWYKRALDLGSPEAEARLSALSRQ